MLSNPFSKIRTQQSYAQGHTIQWWLEPGFKGKAPYKFIISCYQDQNLKEAIFTKELGEVTYFTDAANIKQNFTNDYLYKIKLITDDGEEFESELVRLDYEVSSRQRYLNAAEIVRKEWVYMQYVGQYGWLLKRKVYAPAAIAEVDPVTNEPIVDTSKGSFGTGSIGGYFSPIIFRFGITNITQLVDYQQEGRGTTNKENMKLRTVGFPILNSYDVIVSKEDKRYLVENVQETFYPGTSITLIQNCDVRIIPPTDSLYSFKVPNLSNE